MQVHLHSFLSSTLGGDQQLSLRLQCLPLKLTPVPWNKSLGQSQSPSKHSGKEKITLIQPSSFSWSLFILFPYLFLGLDSLGLFLCLNCTTHNTNIHDTGGTFLYSLVLCCTLCGPRQLSRCSDQLRAGLSGDRIPVGARFSAPVQTGSGVQPASYTMGTESLSWG